MIQDIKFDCRHFKGHIPCKPNKLRNRVCTNCEEYDKPEKRILIIKLGAIGDVIRTTPLLIKYQELYPTAHITWLTHFPDVLPHERIDEIHSFNHLSVYKISHRKFDIAINLDKDQEACMLLSDVKANEKYGWLWSDDHICPATPQAEHKLITGLFDNISIKNTKNYLEEIFEVCHLKFNKEPYLLNFDKNLADKWNILKEKAQGKKLIGLNTGCGKRWKTRLWPEDYWISFIKKLQNEGYYPVVLGGPDEDEVNKRYSKETGAYYPGTYSLQEFISLTSNFDLIVTQVSMMMHIAIGLKIPMVLFNNIFNKHEFELYGKGVILEPETGCDCYYGNSCKRERHCMLDLNPETVLKEAIKLLEANK